MSDQQMKKMEDSIRQAMIQEAVTKMAAGLVEREGKKLAKVELFTAEQLPWPDGVLKFDKSDKFYMLTPDGYTEIKSGDWIIQTLDMVRYYLRFETVE